MPIDISSGPSPIENNYRRTDDHQTTTVQVGENKLSDVAKRLNVDPNSLQQANPNISASGNLKVGQEIHLPQAGPSQGHQDDDDDAVHTSPSSDLPHAPIGDPLTKNLMQAKLDGTAKHHETRELSGKDLKQVSGDGPEESTSSSSSAYSKKVSSHPPENDRDSVRFQKIDSDQTAKKQVPVEVASKKAAPVQGSYDVLKVNPS